MRALVRAGRSNGHLCAGDQRRDSLQFSRECFHIGSQELSQVFFATAGQATSYQGRCELGASNAQLGLPASSSTALAHPICRISNSQSFFCQQPVLSSSSDFPFVLIASSSLEQSVVWIQLNSCTFDANVSLSMKPLSLKPSTMWAHPAISRR